MARIGLTIFTLTTVALMALVGSVARMFCDVPVAASAAHMSQNESFNCYLSTDNRTTLDQLVFHHNLENVTPGLSKADVVFVGNSRCLCAFPASTCAPWFQEQGSSWYHAGFPAESQVFTQHVLEIHNVHAKLVVVNADNFFRDQVSAIARRSVATTEFGAKKRYWESNLSFRTRQKLHTWLPHLPSELFAKESMVVHRSIDNGAWLISNAAGRRSDVATASQLPMEQSQLAENVAMAREFQKFVRDRGGEILITYVPSSENRRHAARQIAQALGCRFVAPELNNLTTLDGSHLDPPSAARFSTAFLEELERLKIAPPANRSLTANSGSTEPTAVVR